MLYDEMKERLYRMDEDAKLLFSSDTEFRCYIVGGGAFVLMGYSIRATHDIDVISVTPSQLENLLNKYDMNTNVKSYIDYFPSSFEERAVPVNIDTKVIKYYTLSLEDLVISKLCTTRGEQDLIDIKNDTVLTALDWEQLEKLANELKTTMLSTIRYYEFRHNYEIYVEENKK